MEEKEGKRETAQFDLTTRLRGQSSVQPSWHSSSDLLGVGFLCHANLRIQTRQLDRHLTSTPQVPCAALRYPALPR